MSPASETVAKPDATGPGPKAKAPPRNLVARYRMFCFRLLGARLERSGGSEVLGDRLKRAGMNMSPAVFNAMLLLTALIAGAVTAAVAFLLFFMILHEVQWFLYVGLLAAVGLGSVAGGFRFLVDSRISNRKDQLDRELPFSLSELSVLASTGSSPIRLIRHMARRDHDPALTATFRQIAYKADVQGKDLITALAETAKESPSTSVRDTLWDLGNMIHQGGNLDEYLRSKSDAVMSLKRLVQKEFIERLSTFLDMYVSLVLVGVLMIAVGAFLLNALGSTAGPFNANELLLLLTFGLVPMAVAMTIILVSIAYSRAE
ncbi:MAG: type II secretion system F family protein [Thermoplasmata archaeon]